MSESSLRLQPYPLTAHVDVVRLLHRGPPLIQTLSLLLMARTYTLKQAERAFRKGAQPVG